MSARRSKRLGIILLLTLLLVAYGAKVYRKSGDLRNFHFRTRCAFSGAPVYVDEPYAITYPPFFLLLVAPYAALPFTAAKVAWYATHLFLLVLLLRVSRDLLDDAPGGVTRRPLFWFLLSLALARFVLSHFENEQFDLFVALAVLGSLELARRGRDRSAGFLLGAGAAAKLTPLLFLVYLFYKRRLRFAMVAALSFVALLFLPDLLLFPFREGLLIREWYDLVLVKVAPWSGGTPWAVGGEIWAPGGILNQSLSVTLLRYLGEAHVRIRGAGTAAETIVVHLLSLSPGAVSKVVYLVEAALAAPLVYLARRSWEATPRPALVREAVLVTLLMLLFSPQTSKPHLVILFPAYGLLLADGLGPRRDRASLLLAALSFLFATLTVDGIVGRHLGDLFQAYGAITIGILFLYAGVLRLVARPPASQRPRS